MDQKQHFLKPYLQKISKHKLRLIYEACNKQRIFVEYSSDAYVNEPDGWLQLDLFLEKLNQTQQDCGNYVSHPFLFEGSILSPEIYSRIGGPQTIDLQYNQIRMARFFAGSRGTGTHVHQHTRACFECLQGEKLWFLAPHSVQNSSALTKFNHEISGPSSQSLSKWFDVEIKKLWPQLKGAQFIRTKEGEALFIPDRYFHATLNLTACIGISYSWRSNYLTLQNDALKSILG